MGINNRPDTPYERARKSIEALGPADQLRLVAEVVTRPRSELNRGPRRSLLELEGRGKEVWQGVDVADYLHRERSSSGE
jgi:hypothetical protein